MRKLSPHKEHPLILGVSASHNGAVCLIRGSEIVVAIQEERLVRTKRKRIHAGEPSLAIQYCLDSAGINLTDLDLIVICVQGHARNRRQNASLNQQLKDKRDDVEIIYAPHHLCHAISAYCTSGFSDSDLLVIDGIGSPYEDLSVDEAKLATTGKRCWEGLSCYRVENNRIEPLVKQMWFSVDSAKRNSSPKTQAKVTTTKVEGGLIQVARYAYNKNANLSAVTIGSLGSMFEAVSLIIFGERLQAGKVMGLAAYGQPTIPINEFLKWENGEITYTCTFTNRFKQHDTWPKYANDHQNLACSVQYALEYAVLKQIEFMRQHTQGTRLCYAGGVALNTLLNERIIRESGYQQVHIVPAAEDSGTAIGAAFYGLWKLSRKLHSRPLSTDNLGHDYSEGEIISSLASLPGIKKFSSATPNQELDKVVEHLCSGKVGAWFQGGSELGPRALGQRSMLCDARSEAAKDYLNLHIKKREAFRPFAPVVLAEYAQEWFDFSDTEARSPFMLRVAKVRSHVRDKIPAVVHIDGSARVQTVTEANELLYELLQRFYAATGVPILLNTSLNVAGEPIVETPEDAWRCLQTTPLAFGMIGRQLITKQHQEQTLLDFTPIKTVNRYALTKGTSTKPAPFAAKIWTESPWGEFMSEIPIHYFYFLNEVDGRRSGIEIMQGMRKDPTNSAQHENTIELLRALHQIRAIRFAK